MIEYIEINGVKHPVRLNRKALIKFEKITGKGIEALGNLDTEGLSQLLYFGIEEGYLFDKKNIPYLNYEAYEVDLDAMDLMTFYDDVAKVVTSFFTKKKKK